MGSSATSKRSGFTQSIETAGILLRSTTVRRAWLNNTLKEISYTHAGLRSLAHPQVFEIETTNACPYTCIMCPRTHAMTRPIGHMDIRLFRDIVDQSRPEWQMDHVRAKPTMRLLHYGEPMVYTHFAESIDHCHRRGFSVYISTNPSVWTDRRIEETLDTAVDDLWVMVDGLDDATSMAIRGNAASFERGERNIRELARRKVHRGLSLPRITIAMIRQPKNAHQWEQFESYWRDVDGIDAVYLAHFSTFDGGVKEINDVAREFAESNATQSRQMTKQRSLSQFPCYYPWHSISILWDGQVVPCCRDFDASMILGDLNRQTIAQIWNGSRMQRLRRNFTRGRWVGRPCETCEEASLEIGLPGRHYPVSTILRRLGVGRMNRCAGDRIAKNHSLVGAQNLAPLAHMSKTRRQPTEMATR